MRSLDDGELEALYSPSGRPVHTATLRRPASLRAGQHSPVLAFAGMLLTLRSAGTGEFRDVTPTATLRHPASLRPADTSMYRRSVGSTRSCISSKRHPISPFRILGQRACEAACYIHVARRLID
jgi:hypothetical protein